MSVNQAPKHDPLRQEVLEGFYTLVMLPLARLLLRFQVDVQEVGDMIKRAYVAAAAEKSRESGKRPTVSRVALVTGLRRPVVSSMLDTTREPVRPSDRVRLIGLWVTQWQEKGVPLEIPITGVGRTFEALCSQVSTKYRFRTVLDELIAAGNVEQVGENRLRLVDRRVASRDHVTRLLEGLIGNRRLLETVASNVEALDDAERPERFQQIYFSRFIDSERLPKLRAELRRLLQRFFKESQSAVDAAEDDARAVLEKETAGVGLFYFEEKKP